MALMNWETVLLISDQLTRLTEYVPLAVCLCVETLWEWWTVWLQTAQVHDFSGNGGFASGLVGKFMSIPTSFLVQFDPSVQAEHMETQCGVRKQVHNSMDESVKVLKIQWMPSYFTWWTVCIVFIAREWARELHFGGWIFRSQFLCDSFGAKHPVWCVQRKDFYALRCCHKNGKVVRFEKPANVLASGGCFLFLCWLCCCCFRCYLFGEAHGFSCSQKNKDHWR